MRLLLINPPWVVKDKDNIWRGVASVMPPLGLAWMAAVVRRDGHHVKILDAHAERLRLDTIGSRIRSLSPFDLVGITATTSLAANALAIARIVKAEYPQARVVLGGVHPTVLPKECLAERTVDLVVRGEGEETLREIAREVPVEDIHGVSFSSDGGVVHTAERELIKDLDSLPLPAYDLLPMGKYYPAAGAYKRLPASSVLATRGCPGRCTFCHRIFGNRLRTRSGGKVAQEVKHLQDRYGIREICFYDDTFTVLKREVEAFCRALKNLGVDVTWSCFSRVDTVDEELLGTMKEAGCHQIMYGIEAASSEILKNIKKCTELEEAENAVATAKKIGIDVRAAFMLGNPGETEETMAETLAFAIRLNPELAIFNITTPFPGTEMYTWAEENGFLKTKNWEDYDLSHVVVELPTVSSAKVEEFYRKAHRRFYLRPRYLAMRVARLRSFADILQAIRALRIVAGV